MTHFYLLSIGCLIILISRKIYRHNFELFLCLLITLNFEFFYLFPRIGQFDQYKESLLVIVLFYFIEEYLVSNSLHKNRHHHTRVGIYGKFIVAYLMVAAMSIGVAFYLGQSLILGIKAYKYYPLLLIYFIVTKRGVDTEKLMDYILFLATFIAILTMIQSFLYDSFHLFYFYEDSIDHVRGMDSTRGLRILVGNTMITIGTLIAFSKWMQSSRLSYLFNSLFLFFHIFFIIQTRAMVAAVITVAIVSYFLYHQHRTRKIINGLYFFICGCFAFLLAFIYYQDYVLGTGMVSETVSDIQDIASQSQKSSSLSIRLLCLKSYWEQILNYWPMGRGLQNITWSGNPDQYLQDNYHLYLSDVGVLHMIVNFGLTGLLVIISFFYTCLRRSITTIVVIPAISSYFILGLVLMPQIDFFFRIDHLFIFSVFSSVADSHTDCKHHTSPSSLRFSRLFAYRY
jgi:hypothetical protein